MKKLIFLLIAVVAVGTFSAFMLQYFSGMQKQLPTSYDVPELLDSEDTQSPPAEPAQTKTASEKLTLSVSPKKTFYSENISIELSCDAPMRPPFTAYMQGGLTFESARLCVEAAAAEILGRKG